MDKIKSCCLFGIGSVVLIALLCFACYTEQHYKIKASVTYLKGDTAVLTDDGGMMWEVDKNTLKKGDSVELTFYTNGTDNRTDDIIQNTKRL